MRHFLILVISLLSTFGYSQITKTGGILYSNGDPNTRGLDTLTLKNLNKNSEVSVDHSTGSMYVFDRSDSTYKAMAKVSELGNMIELTLPQFESSVVYKTLEPGKVYKISGVHKNKPGFYIEKLYDDGNNLGITIYLTALTSSTFTNSGYGEFYNPKYQPASNYANTDKTGMWGIWDTSVTYATNDRAIWGGYMWSSVAGGDGSSTDDFALSADWVKLPYSDTSAYNKVVDYIEYDFGNDFITRRRDELAAIDAEYKLRSAGIASDDNYAIKYMQYGNYMPSEDADETNYLGTFSNTVKSSGMYNCINFKGSQNCFNIIQSASINNNKFLLDSRIINNTLIGGSILNNILTNSIIERNVLIGVSSLNGNALTNSSLSSNTLTNSLINGNILTNSSVLSYNVLTNSTFEFRTSGTLSAKTIRKITANDVNVTSNISAATTIFGDFHKNLYKRQDGTIRMSYYNNSDTLLIVNVNN